MPMFDHYIGIDYSGAQTATSGMRALQVYAADRKHPPRKVTAPPPARNWSRATVAAYCLQRLRDDARVIIGIDHGFSFSIDYMQRYAISQWDEFLTDFRHHWPTDAPDMRVESLRAQNPRTGSASELRLCEKWTATAKSVFLFDVQGSVAKSTHAGLPWLLRLRQSPALQGRLHCWPFDGFAVAEGKSVLAEAYPSLYRRRFDRQQRSSDEHDAWSIAAWMRESDRRDLLPGYFQPPLGSEEKQQALLEGWILGVC